MSLEQNAGRLALVSDEYARAYEAGALAAIEWFVDRYPDLMDPEEGPTPSLEAAEHIGHVIDLMLGRAEL
jgi:hypothetical protein